MQHAVGGRRLATQWVDRSIRTKSLVVIVVPVTILVLVLGATFWFTHVDTRAQNVAGRARQVVDAATRVENSALTAQADIDSYLVDGDQSHLRSFTRARATIAPALENLDSLTPGDAAGTRWAPVVSGDVHRLVVAMDALARRPAAAATGPAAGLLASSRTDAGRLRVDVASLTAAEDALVASQDAAIHTSNVVLPAIAIGALVLALGGGVAVSQLFTAGVVTRLRRLERATEAAERGEPPQGVPAGNDEIGRLAARMLDTTAQLRERAHERDRARAELENILTASPVVSLRYDVAARRFTYASPNIERLLGIGSQEALRDPRVVIDRFHPDSAALVHDAVVAAEGEDRRFGALVRVRRNTSSEEWHEAEAVYTLEPGPEGELQGVVVYLVDVSEQHLAARAAEERRFLLESIFHASPDTIVVRDIDGRAVLASSALADVIGTSDSTATDQPVEQTHRFANVPSDDRAVLDGLIARCIAGERSPAPVVTTGRLPDGDVRTYETRARPVFDRAQRVTGTVTVSRDITERVRLEHSLRYASAEAERASAAKSEFLSRMSHELRTPLNAILGFAQLLELDDLPEDQAASVDQIQRAGHHLLSLINEVLDISRIEAGRLSLSTEPVDVGDVLDEVAALLSPVAEGVGIALSVNADVTRSVQVRADRQRLVQILLNLGSNALKYNERGGTAAFRTETGPRVVRFEVRDTGPGIPHEQQDQLFVPFSRLGAERSGVEGTGVGLALSKQLVEVMGGTIGMESAPGHGSTFWVELARVDEGAAAHAGAASTLGAAGTGTGGARAAGDSGGAERPANGVRAPGPAERHPARHAGEGADASQAAADGPTGEHGTREPEPEGHDVVVLQIEDNPSNASLVAQILAKRPGVRLVSAAEGRSGLELARQHRPDLVLLDLHLPDLPGDELLHRLKAVPELADTKVVVVSADATPSRIRAMLDQGVEGYLTKPVDVMALLRLVDHEIGAKNGEPR